MTLSVEAYVDNMSVVQLAYTTTLVDDKRLRIDIAALRECQKLPKCDLV